MFLLSGGSSILPYLISLVLIWGVLLLNGILDISLKKETKKKAYVVYAAKNTTSSLKKNTCCYEKQPKTPHLSGKNSDLLHDDLQVRYKPQKFHSHHITYSFFQSGSCSFLRRGPPSCIFTSQV